MVILITNGVGESDLGMVMVFCHPDQARREACDALSTLCQYNSSELSVVVIRRYSNTPYIPRGTSCAFYLDMGTFSGGAASAQFLLDRHAFVPATSFQWIRGATATQDGGRGFEDIPPSARVPMGEVRGGTLFFWSHLPVNPPASSCFASGRVYQDWGRIRKSPCLHTDRRWVRLSSCQYPDRRVSISPFSQTSTGSQ